VISTLTDVQEPLKTVVGGDGARKAVARPLYRFFNRVMPTMPTRLHNIKIPHWQIFLFLLDKGKPPL